MRGGRGADGRRAREEEDRRERHVLRKPAQRVERRGMGLREDVARAEKEQALEQRVVERVQQGARDAAQRDELVARGFAQRGDAESDEDDADVLDRGVGQQAFHVVLHGCEDHAPQARDDARREQDHSGGVQEGLFAQRGRHAQDAVDARLDHHARHQGRDVRRGCGVRLRKPDVHREKSSLHAEARQEHQQQRQSRLRAEVVAQRAERGGAAGRVEPYEADDEQHEADVHHNQVGERRAPDFAPAGRRRGSAGTTPRSSVPRKRGTRSRRPKGPRPAWRRTSPPAPCSAARCGPGISRQGSGPDSPASRARRRRRRPR